MTDSPSPAQEPATQRPTVIAVYSRDLFFGMRIRTVVRQLGYSATISQDAATLLAHVDGETDQAALVLVDFNQPVVWDEFGDVLASGVPVVAFGSHTDVDGFRAAKAAGVTRVVSNGEFSRSLADLVARYARA